MSRKRQLVKAIKKTFRQINKQFLSAINKQIIWLLRTFFGNRRRHSSANAGFVLPTVAMVTLVVVLLTTAILFRSFERSKNASNVRVNEAVLNAATPAIDRARAKLDALIEDPILPRGIPSDNALYDAIKKDKYRLGDETRLKLALEFNGVTGFQTGAGDINNNGTPSDPSDDYINEDETLKTAWKYAVDTDNNGKKDTFTLYGIYFRTPSRNSAGQFTRQRKALEARTPPMDNESSNQQCNASGFSSLVGNSSWYKLSSGNLGKSFFVYTVNVPITNLGTLPTTEYESYQGNKSVVALEFQQDRSRVPLANNAVWFENDLEVIVGGSTRLLLNGRIHTNGNFLTGIVGTGGTNGNITFRQVSSKTSCFYNQENGQISVGGNVGNGSLSQTSANDVNVDLYKGFGNDGVKTSPGTINSNKSTDATGGATIGFNDAAFNQRIAAMKTTAKTLCTDCNSATDGATLKAAVKLSSYPTDVKLNVDSKVQGTDDATTAKNILYDQIEIYLRNRTRRVPFAEIPDATGANATTGYTAITASLEPQATWREPLTSSNQFTGVTTSPPSVTTSQLEATQPNLQKTEGIQTKLGDRVFVGNNLPALWKKGLQYVGSEAEQPILNSSGAVNWTRYGSEPPARWRNTQIQALADLGLSDRNGFWEENAAANPVNDLDNVGGVRIVTGAGIYVDGSGSVVVPVTGPFYPRGSSTLGSFLPAPSATDTTIVWPDTMPMSTPGNVRKGDLQMRATAVYHYKVDYGTDQEPIACVSSYFDPSNETTVKNKVNQNGGYLVDTTDGRSNNGVVYNYPGRTSFTINKTRLLLQSNLKFPNGRLVNKPLKDALGKIGTATTVPSTGLQLADYSAVDTALCAIYILSNPTSFVATPTDQPKHGAIREATFLDARETKQISTSGSPTTYNLDLEQRQPLEIRVTDIDLSSTTGLAAGIATTAVTASEYLLPYSGIIYATRDDALLDASDTTAESELLSPTDFRLDSTRRPNGIRLINGGTLARTSANTYNVKEKGLILITNLPAYIKGNFNLHRTSTSSTTEIEEFTEKESTTINFYDRSTPDTDFACRATRPGCPATGGDLWRPATIIADSMTLLSGSFVDGVRRFADYDLNNNTGITVEDALSPTSVPALDDRRRNRLKNGFWENSYSTSSFWTNDGNPRADGSGNSLGSYLVNGVTPIQRRVNGQPLYVMEMCRNLLVSECTANDWVVGFNVNGDFKANGEPDLEDTVSFDVNGDGLVNSLDKEKNIKTYQLGQAIIAAGGTASSGTVSTPINWSTAFGTGSQTIRQRLGSGDTSVLSLQNLLTTDRLYPRRVAFARDNSNNLVASSPGIYKPMGVGCPLDTTGTAHSNNGCTYDSANNISGTNYGLADTNIRALWFRTTSNTANPGDMTPANVKYANDRPLFYFPPIDANGDGSPDLDAQPLLVPVLQIHEANNTPSNLRTDAVDVAAGDDFKSTWLQQIADTTTIFNATFVVGNSPSRTDEISSGLQNFVRFLENWDTKTAKISGSFIQLKRSSFSTAPIAPIFTNRQSNQIITAGDSPASPTYNLSLFDYSLDTYPTRNGSGVLPFYFAPTNRKWGFDVGLLSEQPDLFAQRFTAPPTGRPNEFFREVGRDDTWVKTLLCAGEASNQTGIPATGVTVTYANAVPNEYRQGCPSASIPDDLPPS